MRLVMLFIMLIVTVALGEASLRLGIALDVPAIKNPWHYADGQSDPDYWKLQDEWGGRFKCVAADRVHPLLGWSQAPVTSANPFGLRPDVLQRFESPQPKLLFYGDSFVRGLSDEAYTIPNYLQRHMEERDVVDMSMGGYGLDQIYLMFQETHHRVTRPIVLVGVLISDDLDRTVLPVRTSAKPYFRVDGAGALVLHGVPITREQAVECHRAPLKIKSYLAALVKRKLFQHDETAPMKQAISAKLFEAFKQGRSAPVFVLFYQRKDLHREDWGETFTKEVLGQLGLSWIDTKPLLLKAGSDTATLYGPDGHHNNLGNEVIAEGILATLRPRHARR